MSVTPLLFRDILNPEVIERLNRVADPAYKDYLRPVSPIYKVYMSGVQEMTVFSRRAYGSRLGSAPCGIWVPFDDLKPEVVNFFKDRDSLVVGNGR